MFAGTHPRAPVRTIKSQRLTLAHARRHHAHPTSHTATAAALLCSFINTHTSAKRPLTRLSTRPIPTKTPNKHTSPTPPVPGGGGGSGAPALLRAHGGDSHGAPVRGGGLCQEAVRREHHPVGGVHGERAARLLQGNQDRWVASCAPAARASRLVGGKLRACCKGIKSGGWWPEGRCVCTGGRV